MAETKKLTEADITKRLMEFEELFDSMSIIQKGSNILLKTSARLMEKYAEENRVLREENEKLKKQLTDILMSEPK